MKKGMKELFEFKVVGIPSMFGECLRRGHFELVFK